MVEIRVSVYRSNKWIGDKINPDFIDSYWARAKTKKRCIELLNEKTNSYYTYASVTQHGSSWGTYINRPAGNGEGVWLTRDFNSKDLIPVWVAE